MIIQRPCASVQICSPGLARAMLRRGSGHAQRRGGGRLNPSFTGNFATFAKALGLNVLQGFQPDLGLTEDPTPLATAGNTSTTVLTLTNTRTGLPVPLWFKSINTLAIGSGAQFNIYADGLGVTPTAQSPVTPAIGTPIALTGAPAGLSCAWAAGTSVNNDSWKTQCLTLPDPVGGFPATRGGAGVSPLIAAGTNGRTSILGNGAGQFMTSTLTLPAPGTTPTTIWAIVKLLSTAAQSILCIDGSGTGTAIIIDATPNLMGYNGAFSGNALAATGVLKKIEITYTNSVADYVQWGTGAKVTGTNMLNDTSGSTRGLLARNTGANGFNGELQTMLTMAANGNNIGPQLAALTAAANTYFATTVG
jgi:hypothetical protein